MSSEMNENPIDKKHITETPSILPYAHTIGAPVIKPVDKGKVKGRAMAAMNQQVDSQMNQLYEQMHLLAEQAKKLQERVDISNRIYDAEINFQPLISHIYHLYKNEESGKHIMSMIGPNEWGRSKPVGSFIATVKMLADHTWDIIAGSKDEI
jgi:transcriptional regulator of heat shock response